MKTRRAPILAALALLVLAFAAPASAADSKAATQAYMDYNAAVAKATTLAEVLPYLSADYRKGLESRPKADHPEWLKRLKDSVMKDVKVSSEEISGNKATLMATGTSASGNAMRGKISLVKEGSAWKLDEQGWSKTQ